MVVFDHKISLITIMHVTIISLWQQFKPSQQTVVKIQTFLSRNTMIQTSDLALCNCSNTVQVNSICEHLSYNRWGLGHLLATSTWMLLLQHVYSSCYISPETYSNKLTMGQFYTTQLSLNSHIKPDVRFLSLHSMLTFSVTVIYSLLC